MSEENQSNEHENPQSISGYYESLKIMLESLEKDVYKYESGTKAAGVRLRKGLRLLRDESNKFVKFTLGK